MRGYKCIRDVFVLLLFAVNLYGCNAEEYITDMPWNPKPEKEQQVQTETITLEEVIEAAEGNEWNPETTYDFEMENHDTYAYDSLTDAEKIWYEDINRLLAYRSDEYRDFLNQPLSYHHRKNLREQRACTRRK